eukprot:7231940-Pyramimonas_sp.AAC.1
MVHKRKTHSGIGGQAGSETTGKKSFPFRIVASRGAASGCLESRQSKDSDHVPLSLSLPAEAPLGLAMDLASGRALLSQEGEVEMRRCARSGLLIIRLDQFDPEHVAEPVRPLRISHQAACAQ